MDEAAVYIDAHNMKWVQKRYLFDVAAVQTNVVLPALQWLLMERNYRYLWSSKRFLIDQLRTVYRI